MLIHQYEQKVKIYDQKKAALRNLWFFIQGSISRVYLNQIFKSETAHDMLIDLKNRMIPTDQARKHDLAAHYHHLKKTPKTQHIKTWLQEWEKNYTDCKTLNLSDIAENKTLHDFLHAVLSLTSEFSDMWRIQIWKKQNKKKNLSDLYKIIEFFQDNHQLVVAQKDDIHSDVFTVFYQEKPLESNGETSTSMPMPASNINADLKKICLCEVNHWFKNCFYLIESVCQSKKNWKPDLNIQKQMQNKIKKSEDLKLIVNKLQEQIAKKKKDQSFTSFSAELSDDMIFKLKWSDSFVCFVSVKFSDYHFQDSFILNPESNCHVCNNCSRIYDFQLATQDKILYAGDSILNIQGYDSVEITLQGLNDLFSIDLHQVAFISTFHVNIVTLNQADW